MTDNGTTEDTSEAHGERWHAEGRRIFDENRLVVGEAITPRDAIEMAASPAIREALQRLMRAVAGEMQESRASAQMLAAYFYAAGAIADVESAWEALKARGARALDSSGNPS